MTLYFFRTPRPGIYGVSEFGRTSWCLENFEVELENGTQLTQARDAGKGGDDA